MSMKELRLRIKLVRFAMLIQVIPMLCGMFLMMFLFGESKDAAMSTFFYQILIAAAGAVVMSISAFVFLIGSRYEYQLIRIYNRRATVRRNNGIIHIKNMKPIGYAIIKG